eukprot:8454516-Lingulodinium_polyedra.AAC.1
MRHAGVEPRDIDSMPTPHNIEHIIRQRVLIREIKDELQNMVQLYDGGGGGKSSIRTLSNCPSSGHGPKHV